MFCHHKDVKKREHVEESFHTFITMLNVAGMIWKQNNCCHVGGLTKIFAMDREPMSLLNLTLFVIFLVWKDGKKDFCKLVLRPPMLLLPLLMLALLMLRTIVSQSTALLAAFRSNNISGFEGTQNQCSSPWCQGLAQKVTKFGLWANTSPLFLLADVWLAAQRGPTKIRYFLFISKH